MISQRIPGLTPSRNIVIVSALPVAYPAIQTSSSKSEMYSSMRFPFIFRFFSWAHAFSSLVESWYCALNMSRNVVHTAGILSTRGFRPSIVSPMVLTQLDTFGPFICVRVNVTFFIGELNPATSWFRQRYPLTSSMKSSALVWSPSNLSGSFPIALTSAACATFCCCCGCCGGCGDGGPPPPPPPPPPPSPPPLIGDPGRLKLWRNLVTIWDGEDDDGFGAVEACAVVVNVVALVLAMVDMGSSMYGGGDVTMGEFLIWLSSLSSSGSLSESSDRAFSGSLNDGKSSSTGEGSLASLRTSSRL